MNEQNELENTKTVGARVRPRFAQIMDICRRQDAYQNRSELIREALKEKLQRDVPELYKRYLVGGY
jgi:Arc/MetJ-type ribon-helix-helix transcriptional regulator